MDSQESSSSTKSNRRGRLTAGMAVAMAATAVAAGLGGTAKAGNSNKQPATTPIEQIKPSEKLMSLEQVTAQRVNALLHPNGGFNFYTGKVVYRGADGKEYAVLNPIVDTRVILKHGDQSDPNSPGLNQNSKRAQSVMARPGDRENVFYVLERNKAGNLGDANLVAIPSEGAKFYLDDSEITANGKSVNHWEDGHHDGTPTATFNKDSSGKPDFSVVLGDTGSGMSPMRDKNGQPLQIAVEVSP